MSNAVSVDGRITGFEWDIGLYYELAGRWQVDAHLAGSDTLLSSAGETTPEPPDDAEPPAEVPGDTRPLLVVPDSRGRVRNWHILQAAPYWREAVALCSRSTPPEYLEYLNRRRVGCIVAGERQVDLRAALEELRSRYGVRSIHLDSGGTLNGAMLRAGLVSEVHLLIHPCLVGGLRPDSIFRSPDAGGPGSAIRLALVKCEEVRDEIVWLHYDVVRPSRSVVAVEEEQAEPEEVEKLEPVLC
jgi:2,5-diamino-6-(ribosylamino)-4(3H)-pyrimidinone 5'-phosphate reductase